MATYIKKVDEEGIIKFESTFNYATVDEMVQDLKHLVFSNAKFAYVMMQGLASMDLRMVQSIFNFEHSDELTPSNLETPRSGIILQGPNIFVQTADGKTVEFWKYKTAEEAEENRRRQLINKYAYMVTYIRSERDLADFNEFLEVADVHYSECLYEPSIFESFDEPFAVFCNVLTETDIDGFDNQILDIDVAFLSGLSSKPVNLSTE